MRFTGKTVIVTGGANGIGFAIADRFAMEGANVVICDIDAEAGEAAVARLIGLSKQATFIKCNVADRLSVQQAVKSTIAQFDRIDVLVNNAGIVLGGDFLDITEEQFDKVLNVNLKGYFLMGQSVAKKMVKAVGRGEPAGTIINISSINAVFAIESQLPYSVSKGGVNQLTKAMAMSLAPHGIRVNAVGPGSIATDMLQAVNDDPDARHRILSRTPLGRLGQPSEIAAVAMFLATEEASYITGQTIYADGGRLGLNYVVPVPGAE